MAKMSISGASSGSSDLEEDEVRQPAAADPPLAAAPERGAVLPDRLHRPVAPAVALAPELPQRRRRLRPRTGVLGVDDPPAGAADAIVMSVSSASVAAGDAADVVERRAPESADRAGHRRHALQLVVEAAVEVEAHDVLDVLPAAEQALAVADLRVAGDGAHVRLVAKRLDEAPERLGLEDRVRVDHDDHVVAGRGRPRR